MFSDDDQAPDEISKALFGYSRGLRYGASDEKNFGVEDTRRVARNLIGLSFEAQQTALDDDDATFNERSAHDVARAWEAIANLTSPPTREALTNAAFAYELAGFQANAFSIARLLQKNSDVLPIQQLALYFLHRDFRELLKIGQHWNTTPANIPGQHNERYKLVTVLYSQALVKVARSLLSGNLDQLVLAQSDLLQAAKAATAFTLVAEAPLIRATMAILPVLRKRSTWQLLREYFNKDPRWRRYTKLLARGIQGSPGSSRRAIVEFWPSQITAPIDIDMIRQSRASQEARSSSI